MLLPLNDQLTAKQDPEVLLPLINQLTVKQDPGQRGLVIPMLQTSQEQITLCAPLSGTASTYLVVLPVVLYHVPHVVDEVS